jgi:hypothetical protein
MGLSWPSDDYPDEYPGATCPVCGYTIEPGNLIVETGGTFILSEV